MNKLGHWGITLFVFGFVVAGLVARDRTRAAQVVTVLALGTGIAPDFDLRFAMFDHRGVTHTLPAALVAGIALGTAAWFVEPFHLVDRVEEAFYGFLTGTLGVVAHLAGDIITPMGVMIAYPVSDTMYTFDLVSAHNQTANVALLIIGMATYLTLVSYARVYEPTRAAWLHPSNLGFDTETEV